MAYEWQQVGGDPSWQQTTELTLRQDNNPEYSLVVRVDPVNLNINDHSDTSYRAILEAIVGAVELQGFVLTGAYKYDVAMFQLTEVETEPEV